MRYAAITIFPSPVVQSAWATVLDQKYHARRIEMEQIDILRTVLCIHELRFLAPHAIPKLQSILPRRYSMWDLTRFNNTYVYSDSPLLKRFCSASRNTRGVGDHWVNRSYDGNHFIDMFEIDLPGRYAALNAGLEHCRNILYSVELGIAL